MNSNPRVVLHAEGITKEFRGLRVLDSVSLSVETDEVVGLVGPNGSGKTTLLNIICGFVKPNAGRLHLGSGNMAMAISRKGFFKDMTVQKNLEMYHRITGASLAHMEKAFNELGIDYPNKLFGRLSAGMQQKVSLAFAFMTNARLTLLDEPLTHLDVDAIIKLRRMIQTRKEDRASFLIASHILTDLELVCDRIYFLREGRVVKSGRVSEFLSTFGTLENAYTRIG